MAARMAAHMASLNEACISFVAQQRIAGQLPLLYVKRVGMIVIVRILLYICS